MCFEERMKCMNLAQKLEELLRKEPAYFGEDGKVLKQKVFEDVEKLHTRLLSLLLGNPYAKAHFFREVNGITVFDKEKLEWVLDSKSFMPDSYTRYESRIGLADREGKFIRDRNDVELVWPYKDCVLEGGQDKEDEKRNEVFYNETLAPDEVTRLLDKKVFCHAVRYTAGGGEPVNGLKVDDNLIIKGNNLLVLSSLAQSDIAGKVKCIYIDPPYYFGVNKPSDAFSYNSNFKLSTWLSFLNNRLSLAKKLLSANGVILCHISEDGLAWLKILMEGIFGKENFVETFIWRNTDNPDSLSPKSRAAVEYILCFEKSKDNTIRYKGKETENGDVPLLNTGNTVHGLAFPVGAIHFKIPDGMYRRGKVDKVEIVDDFNVKNGVNADTVKLKGEFKWSQKTVDEEIQKGTYFIIKTRKFSIRFQRVCSTYMAPEKFFDLQYLSKAIGVGTNEDSNSHIAKLGLNFKYSKPESVIAFFLRAVTNETDLVLDFFLGSGTTAAVAHKMGRRYIGIEQMDYVQTVTVPRLQKVIEGEQGGISKDVGWQGGGSFVYCELKELASSFLDRIEAAEDSRTLDNIYRELLHSSYLSWRADVNVRSPDDPEYQILSLEEKKKLLCKLVDKNKLYVNNRDRDDEEKHVTEEEKAFTDSFYHRKEGDR